MLRHSLGLPEWPLFCLRWEPTLSSRGAMVDATDKKGHLPFIILAPSAGNETIGSYASMTDDLSPSSKAVCLHMAHNGH